MNDQQLEKILHNPPPVPVPSQLLGQLRSQITLAHQPIPRSDSIQPSFWALLIKRWIPATAVFASLATVWASQQITQTDLKRENESLRAALTAATIVPANPAADTGASEVELARLQRENAEVRQLKAEIARFQRLIADKEQLEAENLRLVRLLPQNASWNEQFFAGAEDARQKAESMQCINNMKQIGLAALIFATDHEDLYPTSLLQMTNEMGTPKILYCPSDPNRPDLSAFNWSMLRPETLSYQLFLSGEKEDGHPQRILSKCSIHGHVGRVDGSVWQNPAGTGTFREEMVDGRLTLVPTAPLPAESSIRGQ